MAREPYTGGPLNGLNGKAGISAPQNSVSVSGLVRAHNPKSAGELEELIADHVGGGCGCGIVSQGTVEDFGRNLYNAQKQYWGEHRFSLEDCIQWEYDLFILQMLKGTRMEDKCKHLMNDMLGEQFDVRDSTNYIDEELRVDLEVYREEDKVAGIQVKPESFDNIRANVRVFNQKANEKYGKPVLYASYGYETESFKNLETVAEKIREL